MGGRADQGESGPPDSVAVRAIVSGGMQMFRMTTRLMIGAAAVAVLAAACSSSSKPNGAASSTTVGATGSAGGETLTVGVLSDQSGLASSGNKTALLGAEAGATLGVADGIHLKFVTGDTESNPSAALNAARALVEQDHVSAVIAVSALTYGAASYLTQQGIPVVGTAEDGSEWISSKNMFSAFGFLDETKVGTLYGKLFKQEGVQVVGSIGYSISPSSADAAKNAAASSKAAGLKVGYLNAAFPFGSTNVTPIALAMKAAGVQGFIASVDPNTGFALVTALRNANAPLKVALLPTGYGGDLQQAGPGALQSGQGVYFYTSFEPIEMHTAATKQLAAALKTVGVTADPTYAEYAGYTSAALLIDALKSAGPNPSHAAIISALTNVPGFNGAGLFGNLVISMSNRAESDGSTGCIYVTKLEGNGFQLVKNADPVCSTPLPNVTLNDT